ncbi:MAG: HTH-type transcriptional repressor FabR [Pseudomonadales bacterium]|jgi:TetR/AcrR family transcriptional regulator, fatty acid biosynthesis regulator|uniref:HTH-type transcriptional repressor FabR n=1 Tax=unclassified Ketobacter TaxID=2639109 RepID=UPI000C461073|nr:MULTISPECIES: HTH-type transcriptional repressor FabR [unclassified Ketobacter]MAA60273.1 HTH-type transcriptional repressor FabR [Pseudomonadales bacterium]MEC8811180.1 HTH-type transcriptional repressor FabR [Pseudomonadota bacterium]TNC90188.1 MAG: HTH-type transcriptional repressor FabR [Alcanivorax sp.]HAG93427.1 HTH-type transcriptional repressor FabR [Gammaproteobacteria bacterium]MAQ25466.1 HTH-type transcriptional repressor FabR [Pseudomonadales bacterium]|tara:strand:+ start:3531 stop:4181 length:651 start_codon:yes stop_codon:yes gene_type:complete
MTEPLTRAEQKQQTRNNIMAAALKKMNEDKGFSSLGLREVTKEAGIAPASFYRHFKNMEELGLALVSEAETALQAILQDAKAQEEKGEDIVESSVAICMQHFHDNGALFRVLAREATGNSPLIRRAIQRCLMTLNHQLAEIIELEMRRRHRKITNPLFIAEAISTLVFNLGIASADLPYAKQKEAEKRLAHHIRAIYWGAEAMANSQHMSRNMMLS